MKRIIAITTILLGLCLSSWAQDPRNDVTVQGGGFFTKGTDSATTLSRPTHSGGVLGGYRYNINNWLAAEADYDYFSNSQRYFSPAGLTQLQTNVHAVTGVAVVKFPKVFVLQPYVLAGGGGIFFDPRNTSLIDMQGRGTFVYGGGADLGLLKHVALRAQYRGFVYKAPDFDVPDLRMDKFTHSAVPTAGIVFKF